MFSEVKQQLAEMKGELREMRENLTGRPCGKGWYIRNLARVCLTI